MKNEKKSSIEPPPGELIVVQCYAGQTMGYMKVLIDSGSQLSTITENAIERAGESKNIRPTNIKMTSAQGSNFDVKGRCNIELQIGKKDYTCDLVVTPVLFTGVDIILGNDFFSQYHTKLITYPNKEPLFILENRVIPLVKANTDEGSYQVFNIAQEDDQNFGVARTLKPVSIPAWSEGYIKVKLAKAIGQCKKILFTPTELQNYEDLQFLEGTISPHETNREIKYSWLKYRNFSTYPYEIPKGYIVGELSEYVELNNEDTVNMQQGGYINAVKASEERWNTIKDALIQKAGGDSEIQERLLRAFQNHQNTVSLENEVLGTTDTVVHKIDYEGPLNNYTPPYPVPKSERSDLSKEVKRLLKHKKIEKSESCHNSPVLPIRKRNNELRLVYDFRRINDWTAKQKFPLPRIDDILNDLFGGKVFSCLDMKSGYSQVKLHPESRPLTAFTVPEGRYQHIVLPQGLCNGPSLFQSLMCNVVSGLAPHIFCFLDDLIIVSENYEQHEKHLKLILSRLEKHKLSIRIDKCQFFKPSVDYLGFKVGNEGIAPLPSKIEAIQTFPRPQTLFQLRSFLGLTSYYRRFLPKYAEIATPLVALTKGFKGKGKHIKIEWNENAEKSFQEFKEKMCNEVMLRFPDYSKPFRLCTDASMNSLGGVLSQVDEDNSDRPITFFSRVLSDAEKKYPILEKEALALIYGLRINKSILGSFPVEVVSDNSPLIYLMKSKTDNNRVARWQASVLDFDIINFKHLPGALNTVADALSRKPFSIIDDLLDDLPIMSAIKVQENIDEPDIINWDIEELKVEQDKDMLYQEIKRFIRGKKANLPNSLNVPLNQFEVQSDILYFKNISAYGKDRYQCCLPETYREKALKLAHSAPMGGHSGEQHTVHRLKKFAFWPSMRRDAIAFVKNCKICKKYKKERMFPVPILRSQQVVRPFQVTHADLVGPLSLSDDGNRYIMTFIDALTRYGIAVAVPNKKAETIARAIFEKVFCVYGLIEQILTDNGGEFSNEVLELALSYMKVKHRKVTPYRPSANGLCERFNKVLLEILRSQVQDNESQWDKNLCLAAFSYNCGYNRTVMDSPFFLLYGRDVNLPYYTIFNTPSPWYSYDSYKHELAVTMHSIFNKEQRFIEQGQLQQENYRNRRARKRNIQIADRVYILKKGGKTKLKNPYSGPWRVEDVQGVILWVKNIANGERLRVHTERVKMEHQITNSECPNVRACFPVKVPEDDWKDVQTDNDPVELEDNSENNELEIESVLNRVLPITYGPTESEQRHYSTRSKGAVNEESWIMSKAK